MRRRRGKKKLRFRGQRPPRGKRSLERQAGWRPGRDPVADKASLLSSPGFEKRRASAQRRNPEVHSSVSQPRAADLRWHARRPTMAVPSSRLPAPGDPSAVSRGDLLPRYSGNSVDESQGVPLNKPRGEARSATGAWAARSTLAVKIRRRLCSSCDCEKLLSLRAARRPPR